MCNIRAHNSSHNVLYFLSMHCIKVNTSSNGDTQAPTTSRATLQAWESSRPTLLITDQPRYIHEGGEAHGTASAPGSPWTPATGSARPSGTGPVPAAADPRPLITSPPSRNHEGGEKVSDHSVSRPHSSADNPQRHVDIGQPPIKEHVDVQDNLGATAISGAQYGPIKEHPHSH